MLLKDTTPALKKMFPNDLKETYYSSNISRKISEKYTIYNNRT